VRAVGNLGMMLSHRTGQGRNKAKVPPVRWPLERNARSGNKQQARGGVREWRYEGTTRDDSYVKAAVGSFVYDGGRNVLTGMACLSLPSAA
jgi:hypothetical protein